MKQMTLNIEMRRQSFQPVMSIRTRTNAKDLPVLIGESYERIARYLEELDVEPQGPPFVAYYNMDMDILDVEIGFPVEDVLPGDQDLCPGEMMEGNMVSCVHKGSYKALKEVYEAMNRYIEEKGLTAKGMAYETYYNSPEDVNSMEELMTRVDLPVK